VIGWPETVGPYRVTGLLGRGGMAAVYHALDSRTGREVALKVLAPQGDQGHHALRRFEIELDILARLGHPRIPRALGPLERDGALVFFAMEYVPGRTLYDLLDAEHALDLRRAVGVARGMLEALEAAHAVGVVHRDVKPANVLLGEEGGQELVRMTDFGLARLPGGPELTTTGVLVGTLQYVAPELCAGDREADARSDIYAAGVVLYEMLAGEPPFRAASPAELVRQHVGRPAPRVDALREDVPAALAELTSECLARDPDRRPASATQVLGRLDRLGALPATRAWPVENVARHAPGR